jgi:hypothetical protein
MNFRLIIAIAVWLLSELGAPTTAFHFLAAKGPNEQYLSAAGHRLKSCPGKYLLHANTGFRYCSTPVCLSVSSTYGLTSPS